MFATSIPRQEFTMRKVSLFALLIALLSFGFTASAQDDLDEEFESDAITFGYPGDWTVCDDCFDDEFTIILGTSQEAIEAEIGGDAQEEGEAVIYVVSDIEPYLEFYEVLEDELDGMTPTEVEEAYFMPDIADYGRLRTNDEETMSWVTWNQVEGPENEGLDIILQFGDRYVFVGGEAASGEMDDFEDLVFSIAESVQVSDDQRASNDDPNIYEDEMVTFEYPSDWVDCGCPPEGLIVIVGNNPDIIEDFDAMEDGDIQVIIAKDAEEFVESVGEGISWDDDLSLGDALDEYFSFAGQDVELGDTEELDLNGHDAAARRSVNEDTDFETLIVLVQADRRTVVMVYAITRVGTLDDFEGDVLDLAGTIEIID
jgi:hypothetical protein